MLSAIHVKLCGVCEKNTKCINDRYDTWSNSELTQSYFTLYILHRAFGKEFLILSV